MGCDRPVADGLLELVEAANAALPVGAEELTAHLVVSDLGDKNEDAGREESVKPLYGIGVDPIGVGVGDQPQRARVQQDNVWRRHLAFGGLRLILVLLWEMLAVIGTVAV